MNFINLFKASLKALKHEDELSLAYLHGHKLKEIPHLINEDTSIKGVFLKSASFFWFLIKRMELISPKKWGGNKDVFLFSGSANQFNSLASTIKAISKLNISYDLIVTHPFEGDYNFNKLTITPKIALVSFLLFICRAPFLWLKLNNKKMNMEIKFSFNVFCMSYIYVPYFLSVLSENKKVKLVAMSNDHNVDNRSLRVVAELLGIKTLYMQHASVSSVFPPLKFDYALLDGQIAFDTYIECASIGNEKKAKTSVYLSGQKKKVKRKAITSESQIGLAVNALDDIEYVLKFLEVFLSINITVIVRTHPAQSKIFIDKLEKYIVKNKLVSWSNSKTQDLSLFFSSVSCVVAGNSSIHLEAALARLATFYYEFNQVINKPDYYGYVKNGVSFKLNEADFISSLEEGVEYCNSQIRLESLKSYSETYSTEWEHKEGELSALIINNILNNENNNDLFSLYYSEPLFQAYKLKG